MIKYIDKLLEFKWGNWQRQGSSCISGYPSMDVSQMINNGGRGTGLNIDRDPEAEYLDKLILKLPKNQFRSLRERYIYCVPDWLGAEHLKTSKSMHQRRIYRAHENIHNFLQEENPFLWFESDS